MGVFASAVTPPSAFLSASHWTAVRSGWPYTLPEARLRILACVSFSHPLGIGFGVVLKGHEARLDMLSSLFPLLNPSTKPPRPSHCMLIRATFPGTISHLVNEE